MRAKIYVVFLVLLGAGCAATVAPEKVAAPAIAIRSAEEIGAEKVPQAALYLQLAKEQSEHARQVMAGGGDKEQAESLLARAEVDAELARALAREDSTRSEAQQAIDKVKTLKQTN